MTDYAKLIASLLAGAGGWTPDQRASGRRRVFLLALFVEAVHAASEGARIGTRILFYEWTNGTDFDLRFNGSTITFSSVPGKAAVRIARDGLPPSLVPYEMRIEEVVAPETPDDARDVAKQQITMAIELLIRGARH